MLAECDWVPVVTSQIPVLRLGWEQGFGGFRYNKVFKVGDFKTHKIFRHTVPYETQENLSERAEFSLAVISIVQSNAVSPKHVAVCSCLIFFFLPA